ncbi:transposase [Streptomyces sp. NBC_01217]|nr:transposase [Streptomyces sp. NBC_01217]
MTARRPCPRALGPLEKYAARFDDLFFSLAQRRGFREYLTGLLAPRERNKTITCLAGAEPVAGAGMSGVQRLQFFLSESPWEDEQVNDRRLELLREEQATAPGTARTARRPRMWAGKTDNGIVRVTTVWTDGSGTTRCTRLLTPLPITSPVAGPIRRSARNRSWPLLSRAVGRRRASAAGRWSLP